MTTVIRARVSDTARAGLDISWQVRQIHGCDCPPLGAKRGITPGKGIRLRFIGIGRSFRFGFMRYMWYGGRLVVALSSGFSLSLDLFFFVSFFWILFGWSTRLDPVSFSSFHGECTGCYHIMHIPFLSLDERGRDHAVYEGQLSFWLSGIFILKILVSSYYARIYANLPRKHLVLTKGQKKCFATSTRNIEVTRWRIYHKYLLKVYDWIENRYIEYYYAIIVRLLTETLVPLTSIGSEYQCRELPLSYVASQYSRP